MWMEALHYAAVASAAAVADSSPFCPASSPVSSSSSLFLVHVLQLALPAPAAAIVASAHPLTCHLPPPPPPPPPSTLSSLTAVMPVGSRRPAKRAKRREGTGSTSIVFAMRNWCLFPDPWFCPFASPTHPLPWSCPLLTQSPAHPSTDPLQTGSTHSGDTGCAGVGPPSRKIPLYGTLVARMFGGSAW